VRLRRLCLRLEGSIGGICRLDQIEFISYMRCLFFLILIPILSLSQDEKYHIYEYGFFDFHEHTIKDSLAQKWKVEFKSLSGCVVNKNFMDSVNLVNEETYRLLNQIYQIDWLKVFEMELAHYYELELNKEQREIFVRDSIFSNDFSKNYPEYDIRVKIINDSINETIYRGFENTISLIDMIHPNSEFKIQGYNVLIEPIESKKHVYFKTRKWKTN
jgi:hypothetical protein